MLTHVAIATRISLDIDKTRHLATLVGYDFFCLLDRFKPRKPKPERRRRFSTCCEPRGSSLRRGWKTLTPEFLAERVTEPDGKSVEVAIRKAAWRERNMRCTTARNSC